MIDSTSVRRQHAGNSKRATGALYGPLARRADDENRRADPSEYPAHDLPPLETLLEPVLYRARNRVERFFHRIKHFRRLATRYKSTPQLPHHA